MIYIIALVLCFIAAIVVIIDMFTKDNDFIAGLGFIVIIPIVLFSLWRLDNYQTDDFKSEGKVPIEGINYLHYGKIEGDNRICLATEKDEYNSYLNTRTGNSQNSAQLFLQMSRWNIVYCEKQGLG